MSLTHRLKHFSWFRVLALNSLMVLATGTAVSLILLTTPTQTITQALPPIPTTTPNYPNTPPQITAIQPPFAQPGDAISILGTGFGTQAWSSTVTIADQQYPVTISSWSDTRLNLTLSDNLPTDQIAPLNLTINQQPLTIPLSIYDPDITMEIGLSIDRTQLFVRRPPTTGYLIVGSSQTLDFPTHVKRPTAPDTTNLYLIPLTTISSNILATATTPITLTHLFPVANPDSTNLELPFYIHPTNPLFSQVSHLQSFYSPQ